jgi:hypothetical protein
MSSQLQTEDIGGATRDNCHASCTDLVVDILRGLRFRIRRARMAVAQASYALSDVCTVPGEAADQYVRSSPPRILDMRRG